MKELLELLIIKDRHQVMEVVELKYTKTDGELFVIQDSMLNPHKSYVNKWDMMMETL